MVVVEPVGDGRPVLVRLPAVGVRLTFRGHTHLSADHSVTVRHGDRFPTDKL